MRQTGIKPNQPVLKQDWAAQPPAPLKIPRYFLLHHRTEHGAVKGHVLSCIIFSAISSSPPAVDTGASVVTAVWTYVGELAFNLLVLVGAIKGCDRIVKEIMGL